MTARTGSLTDGYVFADLPLGLISSGWEDVSPEERGTAEEEQALEELKSIMGGTEFHGVGQSIREFGVFSGVRLLPGRAVVTNHRRKD